MDEFDTMLWLPVIVIAVMTIMFVFIWVVFPYMTQNDLTEFCKENNYSKGNYGTTIFQKSYCTKEKGNDLIKVEVGHCESESGWCFVKSQNSVEVRE